MKKYYVQWVIDIEAENATEAAKKALEIQRNPESIATVFTVGRHGIGDIATVDVLEESETET